MIETQTEITSEINKLGGDVWIGLGDSAQKVVSEAESLMNYLQELTSRIPDSPKLFDYYNPTHANAIERIAEAIEYSAQEMRRIWRDPLTASRAQLEILATIADRIKEGGSK